MNCVLNDIVACSFYFSDYVKICTLPLQTIVLKFDYVLKQVQTRSLL